MRNIGKAKRCFFLFLIVALLTVGIVQTMKRVDANQSAELRVNQENDQFVLSAGEHGAFYRTERKISDARLINLPETGAQVFIWNEETGSGGKSPFYAISLDGKTVGRIQETSYEMMLRYGKFDPLLEMPTTPDNLTARTAANAEDAYIVQFVTQPLDEYRAAIEALGGKTYIYLPNHAYIVKMNDETRQAVENLPFVRWVGNYQPAYKIEEFIHENLANRTQGSARYNIMVLERGGFMQGKLAGRIGALGGKVDLTIPEGFRMEATLTAEQLVAVANESDVLFVDRWSAGETDMDVVREAGGANFIENTLGYNGQGVRAEVMDAGLLATHTDFNSGLAPILHGSVNVDSHGTATYGINFGRGTTNAAARGMLPEAQGIFAGYPQMTNRYAHTARLLQDPYKAVYQSNSWGSALTTAYTTISAEMDDILFINDFTLLNSQSNSGTGTDLNTTNCNETLPPFNPKCSRPQAWAKNVVSIGGVRHFNTPSFADDRWQNGASIGPAADGRIKPELAHFYDSIFTTTSSNNSAYTASFNGTSSATPITAGHFGIFFQMWHNGIFGNRTGATVFDSRPHMTTVKAVMINTATQWQMAGTDLTRARQGFGRADLNNLHSLRSKMFIVDEADVLTNLQSKTYTKTVPQNSTDPLKVTMVYADPMGSPSATRARINDLSLKVTDPSGTVYWGNNGLGIGGGMWSTAGGAPNVLDTVENVFIQNPAAGTWTFEVIASELVQDARPQTPGAIDADYALVVSGIADQPQQAQRTQFDFDGDGKADVSVFRPSSGTWYLNNSQSGFTAAQFGVGTDKLMPADYDGDGKTDIAVYRSGAWYLSRSQAGFTGIQFGASNDIPVPADYSGDGIAELAIFRPSNGAWYFYNLATDQTTSLQFGLGTDKPVPADYDGDDKADVAVFRPETGTWFTSINGANNYGAVQFGEANDKLVPADYDGDGKADVAVFRPSNGNWYMMRSSLGFTGVQFGLGTDVPVAADYDGDGKADVAVFRNGTWYLLRSQSGFTGVIFGAATDLTVPNAFVP